MTLKMAKLKHNIPTINTPDFYKYYKTNTIPAHCEDKPVFTKFMNGVLKEIRGYVLEGNDFIMPFQLGAIGVRWVKSKIKIKEKHGRKVITGLSINWKGTADWYKENVEELKNASYPEIRKYISSLPKKDKTIIKHFNEHTGGKTTKIQYFKNYPGAISKYRSKRYKYFASSRFFRVAIANAIKENPEIPFGMYDVNIN